MAFGRKAQSRGFSLTELMVVIVLISILATLAFPAIQKRIQAARGRVGIVEMRAIASAQERFRAENLMYLDVSPTLVSFYPQAVPSAVFRNFRDPAHADHARWEVLGPEITDTTPYVYATKAGLAGVALPAGDIDAGLINQMNGGVLPVTATQTQWYVVQGRGNVDGDGIVQTMFTSSWEPNVYLLNEGE